MIPESVNPIAAAMTMKVRKIARMNASGRYFCTQFVVKFAKAFIPPPFLSC